MVVAFFVGLGYLVVALAGGWVGYQLSQRAIRQHEKQVEDRVIFLLSQEIQDNLGKLDHYWRFSLEPHLNLLDLDPHRPVRATIPPNRVAHPAELAFLKRLHLIQEPWPTWSQQVWEHLRPLDSLSPWVGMSQTVLRRVALREREMQGVSRFYAHLERLTTLRTLLTAAVPGAYIEQYIRWLDGDPHLQDDLGTLAAPEGIPQRTGGKGFSNFLGALQECNQETLAIWTEWEAICSEVLSRGTPIPRFFTPIMPASAAQNAVHA